MSNCSDGDLRLIGGTNQREGRVALCLSQTWGSICPSHFGSEDVNVVCRQINQTVHTFGTGKAKLQLLYVIMWSSYVLLHIALVPHVRITKIHCNFKHSVLCYCMSTQHTYSPYKLNSLVQCEHLPFYTTARIIEVKLGKVAKKWYNFYLSSFFITHGR